MRAYKIIITKNSFSAIPSPLDVAFKRDNIVLTQNMEGKEDGVHIEFRTNQYEATSGNVLLTIANVNRYWLSQVGQTKLIKDYYVYCWAGTKITPMLNNQGVFNITNSCYVVNDFQILKTPIFVGKIRSVYSEVEGATTFLRIWCNMEFHKPSLVVGNLTIPAGVTWRPIVMAHIIKTYLKKLQLVIVKIGEISAGSPIISDTELKTGEGNGVIFKGAGGDTPSLEELINEKYKEVLMMDNQGVIWIGKPKNWLSITNLIRDCDLLSQPTVVSHQGGAFQVKVELPLTNRFYINQEVNLALQGSTGFILTGEAEVLGDAVIRYNVGSKEVFGKYFYGRYKIIEIVHNASSRNGDVRAWTTMLTMNYEGDIAQQLLQYIVREFKRGVQWV